MRDLGAGIILHECASSRRGERDGGKKAMTVRVGRFAAIALMRPEVTDHLRSTVIVLSSNRAIMGFKHQQSVGTYGLPIRVAEIGSSQWRIQALHLQDSRTTMRRLYTRLRALLVTFEGGLRVSLPSTYIYLAASVIG